MTRKKTTTMHDLVQQEYPDIDEMIRQEGDPENKLLMGGLRLKTYAIIQRAVEEGIQYGWNRAHKHLDDPSNELIQEEIDKAVMNSLCEVIDFED